MYSIPAYALRFAAHCRSRLRFTEPAPADKLIGTAGIGTARAWIALAGHARRPAAAGRCSFNNLRGLS